MEELGGITEKQLPAVVPSLARSSLYTIFF
jgi:hypothetical protein